LKDVEVYDRHNHTRRMILYRVSNGRGVALNSSPNQTTYVFEYITRANRWEHVL